MGKICKVLQFVFAVGVLIGLLSGAAAFAGYVIAFLTGGMFAEELCAFIYKQFFPVVIRICSISVGAGLLSMYLEKKKALLFVSEDKDE